MRCPVIICVLCAALSPGIRAGAAAVGAAGADAAADAGGAGPEQPFYAPLVPADTIAVVFASDPAGMIKAAGASSLGRLVAADEELSAALKGGLEQMKTVASLLTNLPEDQRELLLEGGCALALLPTPPDAAGGAAARRIPFAIFLDASGLDDDARAGFERSLIASVRLVLRGKAVVTDLGDGTYEIRLNGAESEQFAIAFRDEAVIVGFRSDVSELQRKPALAHSHWYQEIARKVDLGAGLSGYANVDEVIREVNRRRPSLQRIDNLKRLGIRNIAGCGFRTVFDGGGVLETLFVALRRPRVTWVRFLPTKQSRLEGEKFVPPDFDLYVSADVGRGDDVWDVFRSAVGEVAGTEALETLDNWTEGVEMPFGISLRNDIFGSMSGEVFFAIDLGRLSETIAGGGIDAEKTPYLIGFRTDRQPALAAALNRVLESQAIWDQLGVEKKYYTFRGHKLAKLSSFVEPRIRHGFGFVDGYFLFAPRHTTIESAVEAHRTGRHLGAGDDYAALKKLMPEKSNISVFARTSVVYRELLSAYSPWLDDKLQLMAKAMLGGTAKLGESMASIVMRDDGIVLTASSPVGLALGLLSAGEINQAAIRRKVDLTRKMLEETAAAIEQYYALHGTYPARLDLLVPDLLPDLPADPFAPYAGMPVRYHPGPATTRDRRTVHADGYALASNGPDGRPSFDVTKFTRAWWAAKIKSDDDAAVAELKARLYQFRKEQYADERRLQDEGDITVVHVAESKTGGAE